MTDERDPDVQAAELALGLLEGEERAAALRRVLADPDFAAEVERWRLYFAQLFDLWPEAVPPEGLIDRIDLSLGGPMPMRGRRLPWPLLAVVSSAIAAVLLVLVALRPDAPQPPPAPVVTASPAPTPVAMPDPLLVAALRADDKSFAAVYQPGSGRLRVASAPSVARDRVAQLWVIGGDGVPYPLTLLSPTETTLVLAQEDARRLVEGATLAVSIEPPGGSPTGQPTGPVVATGALSAV